MARTFARRSVPRNWRRGFDWDAASVVGALVQNEITAGWLRVPSDSVDPGSGIFITAKTLVKTLVWPHFTTAAVPNNGSFAFSWGIIAWEGVGSTVPTELPDPTNGAWDWIMWQPIQAVNLTGVSSVFTGNYLQSSHTGGLWVDSQRKLPVGRGILFVGTYLVSGVSGSVGFGIDFRFGLKGDVTAVGLGSST